MITGHEPSSYSSFVCHLLAGSALRDSECLDLRILLDPPLGTLMITKTFTERWVTTSSWPNQNVLTLILGTRHVRDDGMYKFSCQIFETVTFSPHAGYLIYERLAVSKSL